MGRAKDIRVEPIAATDARRIVRALHYSGKTVNNSQLHLGVFLDGRCGGALQFGPPLDRRKVLGLVAGTAWNQMIELNRLALADWLPRNSESRALGVALRMLRVRYPHLKWVLSFADATRCGDGTIYRAAGFLLTGIKRNVQTWEAPTGAAFSRTSLTDGRSKRQQRQAKRIVSRVTVTKGHDALRGGGAASMRQYVAAGFKPLPGFQLRYVYFLDAAWRSRLTVADLPFSAIAAAGASMYRGQARAGKGSPTGTTSGEGGSIPTPALQGAVASARGVLP